MSDGPIRTAAAGDLDQMLRLLEDAKLPHEDVGVGRLREFLVVLRENRIVGCVGVEICDDSALLRSLAVVETERGHGIATRLAGAIEARAQASGITRLYLLTTTAESFFARRGYARLSRSDVPLAIRSTAEFASICPASAVCMAKTL